MDILTIRKASTFHGSRVTRGYITAWESTEHKISSLFGVDMPVYSEVQSWPIYQSKAQALDIMKLVAILAYVNTLEFSYTRKNTRITLWEERGYCQLILWYDDTVLLELNNESVYELIEDEFLNPKDFHGSLLSFYNKE